MHRIYPLITSTDSGAAVGPFHIVQGWLATQGWTLDYGVVFWWHKQRPFRQTKPTFPLTDLYPIRGLLLQIKSLCKNRIQRKVICLAGLPLSETSAFALGNGDTAYCLCELMSSYGPFRPSEAGQLALAICQTNVRPQIMPLLGGQLAWNRAKLRSDISASTYESNPRR